MKRYILALGLVLLGDSANAAQVATPARITAPVRATPAREQSLLARVTVYWASGGGGSDHWTRKHQSATGVRLRAGHCAVDPKRIPYGSKILFPDNMALVAVDTGKHVISRKAARQSGRTATERGALVVDRFFETKGQALRWARSNPHFMTVKILSPHSRPTSASTVRHAAMPAPKAKLIAYQPPPRAAGGAYAALP